MATLTLELPSQKNTPFHALFPILAIAVFASPLLGAGKTRLNDADAAAFVTTHEQTIRPLEHAVNLAWWNANVSGKDDDFKTKEEAQNKLDAALADPTRFRELKALKETKP